MSRRLSILVAAGVAFSVPAASARAVTFSNPAPITINDAGSAPAAASPYPSSIQVAAIGTVTKVTATLHGFHHQCSQDVDALLVGPGGQKSILMSDAGDCDLADQPAPIDLTFDDAGPSMPCLATGVPLPAGTYAPTNDPTSPQDCTSDTSNPDVFAPPAPGGPYPLGLATFNGVNPNGAWSLYVMDQFNQDDGAIDGGWSLDLAIPPGALSTAPGISGSADVGKTLTAVSGTLGNGAAAAYQWSRCTIAGTSCAAIAGATQGTYKPVKADKGHALIVTETGVTSGGNSTPLASKATKPVGPAVVSSSGTKKSQNVVKQKGLVASLKSNIGGSLSASATVSVPNGAKVVRFKTARKTLRAGRKTTVKLKLSKSGLNSISGALGAGKKLKAKLTLVVKDAGGGKATKRITVRLKG